MTATGARTADPGRIALPAAVLPGAEVTVAAVGTAEASGRLFGPSLLRGNKTTKSGHCAQTIVLTVIITHQQLKLQYCTV